MGKNTGDENRTRGNWANKWDYLLSLAGYSVGVGNIWRFPYLCYKNGGGAFLIPYVVMVFVVGMPLFLLESSLGQFTSSGCITIYNAAPIFKGAGYASVIVSVVATFYYSMIVAYPLVYLFYSMIYSYPPWDTCDNDWNTQYCIKNDDFYAQNMTDEFHHRVSPSQEFFHNKVLQISEGIEEEGHMLWSLALASFIVNAVVFFAIFKGVKVVGKVVWFTALFPYVMLSILFIRGVTLPGAWLGIQYYIIPDFYKLGDPYVWVDAGVQVFFSLGPGFGTLVTMSSFNKFRHNLLTDVLAIPIINAATSIFAGFVVFSVLGFMAFQMGVPVHEVTNSGMGLAFITYPQALAMIPMSNFWAIMFFIMLFLLGLDSCFVQQEAVVVSIIDAWPNLRPKKELVALVICSIIFLGSLSLCNQNGIYVLTIMDQTMVDLSVLLICILMIVAFIYVYGVARLFRDIKMMLPKTVSRFWFFTWTYVTPIVLFGLFLWSLSARMYPFHYGDYMMPEWTQILGWTLSLCSIIAIPIYCVIYLCTAQGTFSKRFVSCFTPTSTWGPALESHRAEWEEYCASHPLPDRYYHPNICCCPPPKRLPVAYPMSDLTAEEIRNMKPAEV